MDERTAAQGLWGLRRRLDAVPTGGGNPAVHLDLLIPRPPLVDEAVELACALLVEGHETPGTVEVASLAPATAVRDAAPVVEAMLRDHAVPPTMAERRDAPPPSWLDLSMTNSESFRFDELVDLLLPVQWAVHDILPQLEARRVRSEITNLQVSTSMLGADEAPAGAVRFTHIEDTDGHSPEVHCEISGGTFIGSDQDLRVSVAALMERILEEVEAFHAGRPSAANATRDPGEVVLQVRFPFRRAEASWWRSNTEDLLDAITSALDAARLGAVDDFEEEGDEMCVYVLGSKPEAMLDVTRQALRRITIPSGAYALLPRAGQEQLWRIDI